MHNIVANCHTPFEFFQAKNQVVIKIKVCKPTFFICRGLPRQELLPAEGLGRWFLLPARLHILPSAIFYR